MYPLPLQATKVKTKLGNMPVVGSVQTNDLEPRETNAPRRHRPYSYAWPFQPFHKQRQRLQKPIRPKRTRSEFRQKEGYMILPQQNEKRSQEALRLCMFPLGIVQATSLSILTLTNLCSSALPSVYPSSLQSLQLLCSSRHQTYPPVKGIKCSLALLSDRSAQGFVVVGRHELSCRSESTNQQTSNPTHKT
ncbi:hypothetical protein K458DRAFT_92265 [Lentithecium fluviatile CBS 122367]|uniref:Uncharacterized protein n=1 Tax=Lentithecium fluviatile CBS 122367 TaxID=1168545 RepID=A0A6G1IRM1_9PLEO|nr:hypothetical protein K458DRAFT_92265 [Lentithecium fluviatile CBS 122367]